MTLDEYNECVRKHLALDALTPVMGWITRFNWRGGFSARQAADEIAIQFRLPRDERNEPQT